MIIVIMRDENDTHTRKTFWTDGWWILAHKFSAELSFDFASVVGEVATARPTMLSLMREFLADGHGFANAMLDVQSRLLKPV